MYYQEITLLPTIEVNINFIWNKIYTPIHKGFVNIEEKAGANLIGVSFPFYDEKNKRCGLGHKLRLFAKDEKTLSALGVVHLLKNYSDYIFISEIKKVPMESVTSYSHFRRYRPKRVRSNYSLAKLWAKKRNTTIESELERMKDRKQEIAKLPYLFLQSSTNRNRYKIFVSREVVKVHSPGCFSTFGLSQDSTVPNF